MRMRISMHSCLARIYRQDKQNSRYITAAAGNEALMDERESVVQDVHRTGYTQQYSIIVINNY